MALPIAGENATRALKWIHLALGVWLFVSAFVLPQSAESFRNAWIMGFIIAVVGLIALLGNVKVLRANVLFSAWLFLATWLVPYASTVTQLHNALIAIALFVLSLVPARLLRAPEAARAPA